MCGCAMIGNALLAGAPSLHPSVLGNSPDNGKADQTSFDNRVGQLGSGLPGTAAGHPGRSLSHSAAQRQGGASGCCPPVHVSPFQELTLCTAHEIGPHPWNLFMLTCPDLKKLWVMISGSIWAEQVLPTTSMPPPCHRLDRVHLCGLP